MTSFKRKLNELDDSDSEEPSFGKQILPVAELPADFDGEPVDGMQYLFTVRRDAKLLPQFTRVANPYEPNATLPSHKAPHRAPHSALPSSEWREMLGMRWKNFRKNFNQSTIGTSSSQRSHQRIMPDRKERDLWWDFLSGKPESVWNCPRQMSKRQLKQAKAKQQQQQCKVIEGLRPPDNHDHEEENEYGHKPEPSQPDEYFIPVDSQTATTTKDESQTETALDSEPRGSLATPTGTPAPSDGPIHATEALNPGQDGNGEILTPREPSPRLLKLIDERMALHLLMYFTHWINLYLLDPNSSTYYPTNTHARWIFALLLRIDDYVSADDMNLLRNLARACLSFLKSLISDRTREINSIPNLPNDGTPRVQSMDEQAYWTVIAAIIEFWGQRDLWMDAEDMLAST